MFKGTNKLRTLIAGGTACLAFASVSAAPAFASAPLLSLAPSGLSAAGLQLAGAQCGNPTLTQAFSAYGDSNLYTLAPGETADDLTGEGWTTLLTASIKTTTLKDGSTGHVLDLPPLGIAISPPVCVQTDYPTARTMIKTSFGGNVLVGVVYADLLAGGVTEDPLQTAISSSVGGSSTWSPSSPFTVHPGDLPGWQVVQFVFANVSLGDAQLYNFYVDPRMSN